MGQERTSSSGKGRSERSSEIKRRREDAAGGTTAETDGGRDHFEQEQQRQEARRRHLLIEDRLDHRIADAIDIGVTEGSRQHHHHQADNGHAHDVLRILIARQFRKAVFHDDEQTNESPRGHAAQDAEQHERDGLLHTECSGQRELNVRDRERRIGADQHPSNRGGGSGCDDDGKEGPVGDFRQQNFERKQRATEQY
jgi:hypothetical protein